MNRHERIADMAETLRARYAQQEAEAEERRAAARTAAAQKMVEAAAKIRVYQQEVERQTEWLEAEKIVAREFIPHHPKSEPESVSAPQKKEQDPSRSMWSYVLPVCILVLLIAALGYFARPGAQSVTKSLTSWDLENRQRCRVVASVGEDRAGTCKRCCSQVGASGFSYYEATGCNCID